MPEAMVKSCPYYVRVCIYVEIGAGSMLVTHITTGDDGELFWVAAFDHKRSRSCAELVLLFITVSWPCLSPLTELQRSGPVPYLGTTVELAPG